VSVASGAPRRRKEITRVLFSGGYKDVAAACLRQAKPRGCPALPHRGSPSRFSTVDKGMARGGLRGSVCFATAESAVLPSSSPIPETGRRKGNVKKSWTATKTPP